LSSYLPFVEALPTIDDT